MQILTEILALFLSINIVSRLSQLAYKGDLSAKQTISAKKIIHNLNEESVKAMVQLLKLNDTSMSPDELVSMIKTKRTDGSLDTDTELKIKEVVYFKKLFAIKSLVLLLHMDKTDIDLPPEAPQDLIDVIFTPGIEFFSVQDPDESVKVAYENTQHQSNTDFFCMPCFHKAYTQWKCENGIENC